MFKKKVNMPGKHLWLFIVGDTWNSALLQLVTFHKEIGINMHTMECAFTQRSSLLSSHHTNNSVENIDTGVRFLEISVEFLPFLQKDVMNDTNLMDEFNYA